MKKRSTSKLYDTARLNRAFERTGKTVNRFAKELTVDQNTLRRVLAGENVTVETLSHVAKSLGVHPKELF